MSGAVIGMVGVQTSGNSQTRHAQCFAACSNFDCFKVPLVDRVPTRASISDRISTAKISLKPLFSPSPARRPPLVPVAHRRAAR